MQPDASTEPAPSSRASREAATRAKTLSPPPFTLERRVDGKLWLMRDGAEAPVDIVRCFPWTEPGRFLSLRDGKGVELAFVSEITELDARSQRALGPGLARSGFVLEVVAVSNVEEDFELRSFVVETREGQRRFQTALDAWPRLLEDGSLVLEDVYGDLYRIAEPSRLDRRSVELMRPFID